jgi:hypothetical protein
MRQQLLLVTAVQQMQWNSMHLQRLPHQQQQQQLLAGKQQQVPQLRQTPWRVLRLQHSGYQT